MHRLQGETIRIGLVSQDTSAGVPVGIFDSNGVSRPIQSFERLVIDTIGFDITTSAGQCAITDPGANVDPNAIVIYSNSLPGQETFTANEGFNVSIGSTPVATAFAAGGVHIFGTGRIINAKSQGVRAGYKELLTPGGKVNGQ